MIYRFLPFSLDTDSLELRQDDEVIAVEPQVFSLLAYLIENRDRVIGKDELIEAVWEGRAISDGALNSRINAARRAVGDTGSAQAVIKTFTRRGFRFIGDLTEGNRRDSQANSPVLQTGNPSIAVLPFENMSGDPEQEYFSDGISEDIITALSRIRQFFVIARNTTFTYKGQAVDVQSVARELGVRYVLEGSVRKSANRVRISAQLIDGEAGNQIWADRYDRELEDIFAVQDEITNTVVTAIEPELSRAEQIRARRKRPDDLDAWDCYQRALWHVWRPGPDDNEEAKQMFSRATAIDPNFAAAYAGIAIAHLRSVTLAQAPDRELAIQDGIKAARNALAIDDQDSVAYAALSCLDMLRGDLETAIEAADRAIDINPSYAFARLSRGVQYARSGRVEEAFAELDEAERLSPRDPAQWILYDGRAIACMDRGEFDIALSWTRKAIQHPNAHGTPYIHHVAILIKLGLLEEAQKACAELMRLMPGLTLENAPQHLAVVQRHLNLYLDGLRKAGVPEK